MPYPLNNVLTADDYAPGDNAGASAVFPTASSKLNIIVANAAVYVCFMRKDAAGRNVTGVWTLEEFLVPGFYSRINPADGEPAWGVRFRSAATGAPASVSVRAS